jgi:RNA polymerase sigma-70 factor (ECF subfamily)
MTHPDATLLALVVKGDHRAFTELMERHEDRVFSVCLRLMGNREAALDASQETFLTLFRKADQYSGAAAVGTWLYRIAVNTCYDLLRKARRRPAEPLPEHVDPADPRMEEAFTSVELRPSIEAALASLPEEYQVAVILSDLEGLGLPEVAEILSVPLGTVKSRVFRGRRRLAEILGNHASPSRHPNGERNERNA